MSPPSKRAAATLALTGLLLAACGGDSAGDAASHATISECLGTEGDGAPNVSAVVDIENKGSAAASYQVSVTFSSPDGSRQMGSAIATASALAPGQTTRDRVHGEIYGGLVQYECDVASVERIE